MGEYTPRDVLRYISEGDVKFIKLAFCDICGTQKNISILADELPRAFEEGVLVDASDIQGFCDAASPDLLLMPDAATLSILPWRPMGGRVVRLFCDIKNPDGSAFACDTRNILRQTEAKAAAHGLDIKIGADSDFYLFSVSEDGVKSPFDNAGYCDIAPLDRGENIRREICLTLEEMGIKPISSHHGRGPGQNKIIYSPDSPLASADNFITYKSVVKTIASINGSEASFLPKPLKESPSNSLCISISLHRNGESLINPGFGEETQGEAAAFSAGILDKASELSAFLYTCEDSFTSFEEENTARYIGWSYENRSQLIRIFTRSDGTGKIELRSADCIINPYLAFSLIISAGLDGIERGLKLPAAINGDITAEKAKKHGLHTMPQSISKACALAKESSVVANVLPGETSDRYISAVFAAK